MDKIFADNCRSDYYIGLDIGTESVGWAVTDTQYHLIKAGGRELWGSYLFDEAKTAAERRTYRTARRRLARVRDRLKILQSLFADEISKVDDTFFLRLNDGKLLLEDKDGRITTKYILFGDKNFTDKDYFKRYPTIFHLRKHLIQNVPDDIRLLFIACHHILKNRGHFLFEGQNFGARKEDIVRTSFGQINAYFADNDTEIGTTFDMGEDEQNLKKAIEIIKSDNVKSSKYKALIDLFGIDKHDKKAVSVLKLIVGLSCNISDLYGKDFDDDIKADLSVMDDAKFMHIKNIAADDYLLDGIKAIYDWSKVVNILGDQPYLSFARVRSYDMHKSDLALLKKYVKSVCPNKYKTVFRRGEKKLNNYADYIGMDKHKSYEKCSREEFYKFLEKEVFFGGKDGFFKFVDEMPKGGDLSEYISTVKVRYENGEFLPKQMTSDNGVIPYQLHLSELEAILDQASKKFAFLKSTDCNGISVAQKIKMLLTFKIPYYVGPTVGNWAVRKIGMENVKVLPWNINDVIDSDKSEELFIKHMTKKCTYIPTEDVLPSASLLYSEAVLRSEINNIKIDGIKDERLIDYIYEYALSHKKITRKKILDIMKINGYDMHDITEDSISGIDDDIKASLSSYIDFKHIVGDIVDSKPEICERIINWITLISDKNRLEKRIRSEYGNIFTCNQIKEITGLKYSGWGRLSKVLLTEIYSQKTFGNAGEPLNVIQAMRDKKINLTEALTSERMGFATAISEYNKELGDGNVKIDDLYCSPSVKRAIRRTLALVKEIVKIKGYPPVKIMIETARGGTEDQKAKRTVSKKQQLLSLYKNVKNDARDFSLEIDKTEERKFSSRKLYAYYMQQGKCMYSGEPIDINELDNDNKYDIDHIYPRAKINDDSFDNRVLVKKTINASKTDKYPLPAEIRNKMFGFWKMLRDNGFMSEIKFRRLTRNTPLSPSELAEFENRQLVMTRQSTKEIANVLKRIYFDCEIVYSKASKAVEFKDRFDEYAEKAQCDDKYKIKLIKVRELNNLHHAKDAYINIVVGNVFNEEYGHDAAVYYKDKSDVDMRSDYVLFRRTVKNAWIPARDIPTVAETYYKNNCRTVRFVSENTGQLFDLQPVPKGKGLIPLKANGAISDTEKYGGYNSAKIAYFALVKSKDKKGKIRLSLEGIPVMIEKLSPNAPDSVKNYINKSCGLIDPEIVIPKIRINTLFTINGTPVYLSAKSENRVLWCNAIEPVMGVEQIRYIKKVTTFVKKYTEAQKYKKDLIVDEKYDGINNENNMGLYDLFADKLNNKIYSGLKSFVSMREYLINCRQQFSDFSLGKQCLVIMKLLAYLNCNRVNLDWSDFMREKDKTYGKNCGVLIISKFIEDLEIKIINQSPTGHYRQVIALNKFVD